MRFIIVPSRMLLPRFEYLSPKSLEEAASLLHLHKGQAKILAGGTDLLVELKKKAWHPGFGATREKEAVPLYLIGLKGITQLTLIEYSPGEGLIIGSLATYAEVADSAAVKEKYPLLWHACRFFSRPQVRYAGTLAGNLCNASPSADIVPVLIALGAKARTVSAEGEREVPVEEFCLGPFNTVLRTNELVAELRIPEAVVPCGWSYQRKTKRTVEDEALVIVAVLMEFADSARTARQPRIVLGSVAPRPMMALNAEAMIKEKKPDEDLIRRASEAAAGEAHPRSRGDYRRMMTRQLVAKALSEAWASQDP